PHAAPGPRSLGDGGIHLAPGFLHHAERAVRQATGNVLARAAERGELEVVDPGTAVHREMRDHAAPHQLPQQRAEADLDDVTPEQQDDGTASRRARNLVGDVAQVLRGEDVAERAPKGGEALVAAGRVAEEGAPVGLVALADLERNGADPVGERRVVEWLGHGVERGVAAGFAVEPGVRVDVELPLPRLAFLLRLIPEPARTKVASAHPGLE